MNELYHHGIKGMHWGVRRFQNPDGTLTSAGKRRQQQLERNIDDDISAANANKRNASYHLRNGHPVQAYYDRNTAVMLEDDARRSQRKIDRMNAASEKAQRQYAKRQRMWNAKNSALLSDKELTDQILRLQREKQLKDLTNQSVAPGRKRVKDFLARHGDLALSAAITAGVTVAVNKQIKDRFDPRKTTYDSMRENAEAQQRLAKEGYYQKHYDREGNPR